MRTVKIKTIFEAIIRLRGYDPATADLSAAQKADIASLVNERMIEGWEYAFWPELMKVEQRQYRPTYDATENYATDDEVFYEDVDGDEAYYTSLTNGNVGNTPDYDANTTYWAKVGDSFERTIDLEQTWESNPIGAADSKDCIYDRNPNVYPGTEPIADVEIFNDYILVKADKAPLKPYVRFRPPPAEYSYTDWASGTAYSINDLVYLESYGSQTIGETFKALTPNSGLNPYSNPTAWEPIYFPRFLKRYVIHAVNADQASEDEGRYKEDAKAMRELERLVDTLVASQGMNQKAVYRRS